MYFYLAYVEVKRYFRDPGALGLSLALPIALLALMLGAFGSDPSFNGTATTVDLDETTESARLIELIDEAPGLDVEMLGESRADRLLDRSARLLVTVIHEGYGEEVAQGGSSPLLEFRQRGSGGDEGSIVASIVRGAASKHAAEEQAKRLVASSAADQGLNVPDAEIDAAVAASIERQGETPFVSVKVEKSGETTAPFNIFFPGILTMMVMFAVTLNAISIVEERLDGRLERLLISGPGLNGIFVGKFLAGSCARLPAGVHIGHAGLGCVPVVRPVRVRRDVGDRCRTDGFYVRRWYGHRVVCPDAGAGELVGGDHHYGDGDSGWLIL